MISFQVNLVKCLSDNYSYIIFNTVSKKAIIIDPAEAQPIINEVENLGIKPEYILITHHHADHTDGNLELKKVFNCKIIGYENDSKRIPGIDVGIKDKGVITFENEEIELNFSPGHTSGHVFYYFKKNKIAFVGDVVFSMGCGRVFEGTLDQMYNSVMKIKSLPDETKLYCGHEYTENNLNFCLAYDSNNENLKLRATEVINLRKDNLPTLPTTVLSEKKNNIFFRCDDEDVAKQIEMTGSKPKEIFKKLRELKDNF